MRPGSLGWKKGREENTDLTHHWQQVKAHVRNHPRAGPRANSSKARLPGRGHGATADMQRPLPPWFTNKTQQSSLRDCHTSRRQSSTLDLGCLVNQVLGYCSASKRKCLARGDAAHQTALASTLADVWCQPVTPMPLWTRDESHHGWDGACLDHILPAQRAKGRHLQTTGAG